MHAHDRAGLGARLEEGIPVTRVDARQPEMHRDLAERHRVHTTIGVAANLEGSRLHVPQRDQADRDEATARVTTPFLDRPVVVGLDARQGQLLVRCLGEGLPAEPREGRIARGRFHPVDVHVRQPGFGVVAPRPHVVVGDRRHRHLVARVPDGGDHPLVRVDQVLVDPCVDLDRRCVVELLPVGGGAGELDGADAAAFDLRSTIAVLRRQPRRPQMRRFDDVVVDADDLRDRRLVHHDLWWLRARVRSASTVTMSRPLSLASALACSHSASETRACSARSFHVGSSGAVISRRSPLGSWK